MTTLAYTSFGVVGAGAWGTACAQTLARAGREVVLWAREGEVVESINTVRENALFLPGVELLPGVHATSSMADLAGMDAVLAVAPAQHMRAALEAFAPHAPPGLPVVLCSKGIELGSRAWMSEVLAATLPHSIPAVLAGPSFAVDVASGLPAAVTLACADETVLESLGASLASSTFRPYLSGDVLGAEIGGAVKNVLAIACGVVLGLGLGRSAHAALIARGFAEMRRLGAALGCDPDTLTGLCGLGDLVLTCSSEQSRNMSCGLALGRGVPLSKILEDRRAVTEGVATAPALRRLAEDLGVDMPISATVAAIVAGEVEVGAAADALLSRQLRREVDVYGVPGAFTDAPTDASMGTTR